MMLKRRIPILFFAMLCSCASPNEPPAETEPVTEGDESLGDAIAEVPFAAAEIRAATLPGRTYLIRFVQGDETRFERWVFEQSNDTGYTLASTPVNAAGEPQGDTERSEGTWDELESHAHFPAAATQIEMGRVSVQMGEFACRIYTVRTQRDGREGVQRFWFATDLPGAPIRMTAASGGQTVVEMEIVAHTPGADPEAGATPL